MKTYLVTVSFVVSANTRKEISEIVEDHVLVECTVDHVEEVTVGA